MNTIAVETLTPRTLAGLHVKPVQERSEYLNILIYGDSGVGKTVLAGSADAVPAMRPVLFVDIEGGTESLRNVHPDVEVVRITSWKEMQSIYDALHEGNHDYRTVVLDSLTEIQKFNMYNIMTDLVKRKEEADPDIPGMREWGKNIEQMRRFVRAFRDLQMHTIFTALMRSDKDNKTGLTTMKPSMSGKVADEVAAFLDVVVYYYVKQVGSGEDAKFARLLLTQKTEQQIAKDRTDSLPVVVEEPSMAKLFGYFYPTANKIHQPETESQSKTEPEGTSA